MNPAGMPDHRYRHDAADGDHADDDVGPARLALSA
jgi:hypothetical protein